MHQEKVHVDLLLSSIDNCTFLSITAAAVCIKYSECVSAV